MSGDLLFFHRNIIFGRFRFGIPVTSRLKRIATESEFSSVTLRLSQLNFATKVLLAREPPHEQLPGVINGTRVKQHILHLRVEIQSL